METKVFSIDISRTEVKTDGDQGIVTAYASVFNNVDSGLDRVRKGAFTKTLKSRDKNIIYLPSHDYGAHISQIPGVPMTIEEDDYGLKTVTKFFLNTPAGRDSFEVIKGYQDAGRPLGLSFTYEVVQKAYVKEGNKTVRDLIECELYEYGHCPLPMNEAARTTGVKYASGDADAKANIGGSLSSAMYDALTNRLYDWLGQSSIDPDQFTKLHGIIGEALVGLLGKLGDLGDIEVTGSGWGWFSRTEDLLAKVETDLKAGRVMSQRNLDQLHNSITNLQKVHTSTCDMGDECPAAVGDDDAKVAITTDAEAKANFDALTGVEKLDVYYKFLAGEIPEADNKATWSTAYVNDLPDSSFAYVGDGKRLYPHHDADGKLDIIHLKNALSCIDGDQSGKAHLDHHARAEGLSYDIDNVERILAGIKV